MNAPLAGLESFFGGLLTASWQASVLALLVLGLQAALGVRLNPRWRYALWLLVLVRLLLPFQVESALSLFQFAPAPSAAFTGPMTEPLFSAAPISPAQVTEKFIAPPPDSPSLSLFSMLALVWLGGVAIFGLLTFETNRRFARHVAVSPDVTDPVLLTLFEAAQTALGTRRSVRLIESAQVGSPAIMGLFRPTLLLPARVRETFDLAELRLIFLHELAHLKRGDVIAQGLIALLQVLHWFNPILWFAFRRMRADREPAADALVLSRAGEGEKERYGLMLLKLLERFHHRHALPTLVGILEDKDPFKRRFQLIARYTRGAYGWSTLGLLIIGAIAAVGLTTPASPSSPRPLVAAVQNTGGVAPSTNRPGSQRIKVSIIIKGKALKDWAHVDWTHVNFKGSEIDTPTVSRFDLGSTTIPNGGTGQLNNVLEFPYPIDFELPEQVASNDSTGKKRILVIPITPREFVTTPVGWSMRLQPNVEHGQIRLGGIATYTNVVMQHGNGNGVYGSPVGPIYGTFTDPKTGKISHVLLPENTAYLPVFTQSQTPFFIFCQPGRDYDIRLQYGSDWVTATVRCELEPAVFASKSLSDQKSTAFVIPSGLQVAAAISNPDPLTPPPVHGQGSAISGRLVVPDEPELIDFVESKGQLRSVDGGGYDFRFRPDGSFTIPQVQPGVYNRSVTMLRKTPVLPDTLTEFTVTDLPAITVAALPAQTMDMKVANPFIDRSPPGLIRIELQVGEVADDNYQANREKIDAAVKNGDVSVFLAQKDIELISTPTVATEPAKPATIEIVREFPYPTSFAADKNGKLIPTDFVRADLGIKGHVTAVPVKEKIRLNCELSLKDFEGFAGSDIDIKVPTFSTMETNIVEEVPATGELRGVWIPGIRYDEETVHEPGKPDQEVTVKKRLFLLLAARPTG